jgi:hypothetical protein
MRPVPGREPVFFMGYIYLMVCVPKIPKDEVYNSFTTIKSDYL